MNVAEQMVDEIYGLHCDIGRLEVENARLRDENARLRSCLSDDADNAREIMGENTKLLGLVFALAFCANDEADCDQCPMNGAHCDAVKQCFCDGVANALRGVGIEVDDG